MGEAGRRRPPALGQGDDVGVTASDTQTLAVIIVVSSQNAPLSLCCPESVNQRLHQSQAGARRPIRSEAVGRENGVAPANEVLSPLSANSHCLLLLRRVKAKGWRPTMHLFKEERGQVPGGTDGM